MVAGNLSVRTGFFDDVRRRCVPAHLTYDGTPSEVGRHFPQIFHCNDKKKIYIVLVKNVLKVEYNENLF